MLSIVVEQDMLLIKGMEEAKVSKGLAGIPHIFGSCIAVSEINDVQIFHSPPKVLHGIHAIISVNVSYFYIIYDIYLCIKRQFSALFHC